MMPDFRAYGENNIGSADGGGCPYLTKEDGEPLCGAISTAESFIHCESPGEKAALNAVYPLEGFGCVVVRTRPLPDRHQPYNLSLEFANGRKALIDDRRQAWQKQGFTPSRITREEFERAETVLRKAGTLESSNPPKCAALADKALKRLMWAGEALAIEAGKRGIEVKAAAPGPRMLLGGNYFSPAMGDAYNSHFEQLFNFAIVPFHWSSFEPRQGAQQWAAVDQIVDWLKARGFTLKGHPLVWFHEPCYPKWACRETFDEVKQLNVERVEQVVGRCDSRIAMWDVVNEAHDIDRANMFGFQRSRLLEVTESTLAAARRAGPSARLAVGISMPFAEYAAASRGKLSPCEYIRLCKGRGVEFDIIGVQFYCGGELGYCRDLLEVSAVLDRFAEFGKPLHVTQMGCPSVPCPVNGRQAASHQWHGKWSESTQAEWAEKFYTVCCGKSYVEAVTWWDFADYSGAFITNWGLLRRDFTPKPAYGRLLDIARNLGVKREQQPA